MSPVLLKKYFGVSQIKSNPLLVNVASLGIMQAANYIIPIVIIPFVVRALGVEMFGRASYAQNIAYYLTILVTFGFDYSATQDVAVNRDDKGRLRNIFWTVVGTKTALLLVSFLILAALCFLLPKVGDDPLLYFYAAMINVGYVFFPNWFFQGMEKMAGMSAFGFLIRLLGAVLVVLLVSSPDDYRLYLLLLSLSNVLVGLAVFFYVIKSYGLAPKAFVFEKAVVGKSFWIFLNMLFATLYSVSGLTILGLFADDVEIGLYSGVYKIIMAFVVLASMPVNVALFPKISRAFDKSAEDGFLLLRKAARTVFPLLLLLCACICLLAPQIVRIALGVDFLPAIGLLRMFSVLPLLVTFASFFTVQCLYGLGMQKFAPVVGGVVGVASVSASFLLIPLWGSYGAILAYLGSEVLEILLSGMIVLFLLKRR